MKWKLVYPQWRKLERQTPFNLPPHGPVVFAGAAPEEVEIEFIDTNVDELDYNDSPDLVCLSVMLTAQLPHALEIAAEYSLRRIPVIAGGIAVMLHHEQIGPSMGSVFLGEAEGRMDEVLEDLKRGELKPVYDYMHLYPNIELVGTARRDILNRKAYSYRDVQMVDLVHASRGCRFKCFPCCTGYLGGSLFRPRPIDLVEKEIESIDNDRLFLVDNSLSQDSLWEENLFKALIPFGKSWVSHPIEEDDNLLNLAYLAGCWYVYQAVFDTSDTIRRRIQRYHDHGIKVEATVILGTDDHDVKSIKELVDFLLEVEVDLAEFTILTPFAHSPIRAKLQSEGRILSDRFEDYTGDRVVFQPLRMTPEQLQEMYDYAWDTFYADESQELKMGRLFISALKRQAAKGRSSSVLRKKEGTGP